MAPETVPADPATGPAAHPPAAPHRRFGRPRRRTALRAGAAVLAGLLMWLSFPPTGLWWLGPPAVALLTLTLHPRCGRPGVAAGARIGLLCGAVFFVPVLSGIGRIGPDAWLLLAAVQALYFAPLGAALVLVLRAPGWPLWTAALWVAQEAVRGRAPFGGFPWARLAFGQTASPYTPFAALGGAPLVTFMTALTGALLAAAVLTALRLRPAPHQPASAASAAPTVPAAPAGRRAGVLLAATLTAVPVIAVAGTLIAVPVDGRPVTVAVIQGNVPRLGLDFNAQRRAVLDNHVARTHELADLVRAGTVSRPELVIWPENASDLDPYTEPEARALIDRAVRDVGVPVLVGAVVDAADPRYVENRGIVWDPRTGPGEYYVKRHPVPFGEYLPFRDLLTKVITRFERIPRDFARGERPGVMRLGPAVVGDVICFEVAYDGVVRDAASAEMLVVQTNNATYGRSSLPAQQIAMSRLRAVEHGRSVLVAATSGISAIVTPDGRMIRRSREFEPAVQVASVPARTSPTVSDRLGAGPEWALAGMGVLAAGAAWAVGRRRPERSGTARR